MCIVVGVTDHQSAVTRDNITTGAFCLDSGSANEDNKCDESIFEPRREKICLQSFRPGLTEIGLYRYRRWLGS